MTKVFLRRTTWSVGALILTLIVLVGPRVLGAPLLPLLLVAVGALFVNGLVATLEDELPGGFNPTDAEGDFLAHKTLRVIQRTVAALLLVLALAFAAIALSGSRQHLSFALTGSACCVCSMLSVLLASRRWLWFAGAVVFVGLGISLALQGR